MFSNNSRSDNANLQLSKNFFDSDINEKYDKYISLKNSYFKNIQQVINESIIHWNIPGAGQELIKQETTSNETQAGRENDIIFHNSTEPLENLIDQNDITITFRLLDGFINYFYLYELFFKKYMNKKKDYRFDLILTTLTQDRNICFSSSFSKCIFKNIQSLNFGYNMVNREYKEFEITVTFSDFSLAFDIPQGNNQIYNKSI